MSEIRIISRRDTKELLTLSMAIDAVEKAYRQKYSGEGKVWPMVFHEFTPGEADLDIKSGNLDGDGIFGLKVVSWFGNNSGKGIPALFGTSMIFDVETGEPRAVLNAGAVTDFRTGAAGAVGARYLARKDSKTVLMVGCGALAPYLIASTLVCMPGVQDVILANPHNPDRASGCLRVIEAEVRELLIRDGKNPDFVMRAAEDLEEAVRESDIILTATPSREPMIRAEWIRPGTHLSCVGADMEGKQEIESQVFLKAKAFGDDESQCFQVGECEKPYKEGILKKLAGEIGEVIAGEKEGRSSDTDITVFDSTGIALQDLASAAKIVKLAEERGIGVKAEF